MKRLLVISCLALVGGIAGADKAGGTGDQSKQNMTGRRELSMQHCPSAVKGATTSVTDTSDGVVLTIIAPADPVSQAELRSRVRFQEGVARRSERGTVEHTGHGTGSGRFGFCPGMLEGTTLDASWIPGGVSLTIRGGDPARVERLQRSTHERARALARVQADRR